MANNIITDNEFRIARLMAERRAGVTVEALAHRLGVGQRRARRILHKTKGLKAQIAGRALGQRCKVLIYTAGAAQRAAARSK